MNQLTLIFIVFLFFAFFWWFLTKEGSPSCARAAAPDRLIRVGYIPNFPPFHMDKGGMDKDLFVAVAKEAGFTNLQWIPVATFDDLLSNLVDKKIDVIANNLWKVPALVDRFAWTIPYYVKGGLGFTYRLNDPNSPYKTMDSIQGKRLGHLKGDIWIYKEFLPSQHLTATAYNSMTDMLDALLRNELDVVIEQITAARYYGEAPAYRGKLASSLVLPLRAAYPTRLEDCQLSQKLGNALEVMWENGTLYSIKSQYLSPLDIEPRHFSPYGGAGPEFRK